MGKEGGELLLGDLGMPSERATNTNKGVLSRQRTRCAANTKLKQGKKSTCTPPLKKQGEIPLPFCFLVYFVVGQ